MESATTFNSDQYTHSRRIIIVTIMLVAILEVLDSTIVNVALPHMMASLGANSEQITWVLTSYVVASAIMLPLTGFLSNRLGRKLFLLIDIAGFMIASFLCGLTSSLTMMVVLRLLQGMFGAGLIPISQSVMREVFPPEQQGKAMAIWGVGIMAAPVLGPTIGGYITEYSSWRWVFYINIPICIIGFFMTYIVIPASAKKFQKIDWTGLILLVAGIASLQLFLDQGNEKDWTSSHYILGMMILSATCIISFIIRGIKKKKDNLITLNIYKNRNFTYSSIALFLFCAAMFGTITLQPIMLENLFHYPAVTTGLIMGPRGIASAVGMMISAPLMSRINVKYIIIFGAIVASIGSFMMAGFNLSVTPMDNMVTGALQGLGMGMVMIPISTYALLTITKDNMTEAAGLFSYGRMLGTSVGISLLSTLLTRETQINWNRLAGHTQPYSYNFQHWLAVQRLSLHNPTALSRLGNEVYRQANMIAFVDAYYVIGFALLLIIPLALMLKTVTLNKMKSPGGH